jgi:hypothetical protein
MRAQSIVLRSHERCGGEGQRPSRTCKSLFEKVELQMSKPGLYANINAKRKRIAAGSGEKMRKPGSPGAPTAKDFKESAKTAKPAKKGKK